MWLRGLMLILEWNVHVPSGHLHKEGFQELGMWIGIRVQADSTSNEIGYFPHTRRLEVASGGEWEGALLCEVGQGSTTLYLWLLQLLECRLCLHVHQHQPPIPARGT